MFSAGIDLGTTFIKTSSGLVFPSGVSDRICLSPNVLQINGKKYAMELFNSHDFNINKTLNQNIILNYIYALGRLANNSEEIFENVSVALPCSQWKNEKTVEQFKQLLDLTLPQTIKINNKEITIQVEKLNILPEGASAYYAIDYFKFNGQKVLILDWGGLTLNQILFEDDEIVDLHTDEFGILKIYKDMAEKITSETGYNVKFEDMFDILISGLYIQGKSVCVDDIIKDIALEHCRTIYKNLTLKWSVDTIPFVSLVGASSITMYKYIKQFIPHAELENNAQSLTAIGMDKIIGCDAA